MYKNKKVLMILDISIPGTPPSLSSINNLEAEMKSDLITFKSQLNFLKKVHSIWRKAFFISLMSLAVMKFGPAEISNQVIYEGVVIGVIMLYFSGMLINWLAEKKNGARSKVKTTEDNIVSVQPLCPVKNASEIILIGEAISKINQVKVYADHLGRTPIMLEFLVIKKLFDKVKKEEEKELNILKMPEAILKSSNIINSICQKKYSK